MTRGKQKICVNRIRETDWGRIGCVFVYTGGVGARAFNEAPSRQNEAVATVQKLAPVCDDGERKTKAKGEEKTAMCLLCVCWTEEEEMRGEESRSGRWIKKLHFEEHFDSSCILEPGSTPISLTGEQKQDDADRKFAIFFFQNSIPFSAAKSMHYQDMVDAIAQCGVGYKAPSYEKLRSTLLEKVKADIHNDYKKYRDEWKETGCTVLCDNWSDDRIGSLAVFSVACVKGTLFLKSVNVSGHEDDSTYLFELLESVVLEDGLENVVQVMTDVSAGYVCAGRLLTARYNKMLEDIGRQDWVTTVLEDAKTITQYIYSHARILNCSEPLVKLLRMVDGDMPAMGYIYEGMESAKVVIKAYYKGVEEKYLPIWEIIDRRWNMKLNSSLHAAAAFLNPSISYNPNLKKDMRMRNGFQEAMLRLATTDKDKMEITKELPTYINAEGAIRWDGDSQIIFVDSKRNSRKT
ncbi:hypothetical protein V8G54_000791 [Vigna mungo]|uniref:DUF659 domain-containing protein n=1 Tax=Vigna mungo TaxID=3915 RepID=A0AAQ3S9A0_VIGMU